MEVYKSIKKIIDSFILKSYWLEFTSADIFYIANSNAKEYMSVFIDKFFGTSYGVEFFTNKDGFNYVHDILSVENQELLSICDCDSLCAVLVSKENLTELEKEYLKLNKTRIKEDNNLIIYRFKKGYSHEFATYEELNLVLEILSFLNSMIENEHDDLIKAFDNELSVVSFVNLNNYTYSNRYMPLPILERPYNKTKINIDFVNEYQNKELTSGECYVFTTYLPVIIAENDVRPILVYIYYQDLDKHLIRYIADRPKTYNKYIYGILDEAFSLFGLPYKITFNSRELYYILYKSLSKLNIEKEMSLKKVKIYKNLNALVSNLYSKTDDDKFPKEEVISLLNEIVKSATTIINEIDNDEYEYIDYDSNDSNLIS